MKMCDKHFVPIAKSAFIKECFKFGVGLDLERLSEIYHTTTTKATAIAYVDGLSQGLEQKLTKKAYHKSY